MPEQTDHIKKKMRLCEEDIAHINIVNWFHEHFSDLADDFYHFANERKCSVQQGRLLKRKGVKKGVADFFLALPLNGKAGLWIELKVGSGKLSTEQQQFLARMRRNGYEAVAVRGENAVKTVILTYLNRGVENEVIESIY